MRLWIAWHPAQPLDLPLQCLDSLVDLVHPIATDDDVERRVAVTQVRAHVGLDGRELPEEAEHREEHTGQDGNGDDHEEPAHPDIPPRIAATRVLCRPLAGLTRPEPAGNLAPMVTGQGLGIEHLTREKRMTRTRSITVTIGSLAAGAILATGVTGIALADDAASGGGPLVTAQDGPPGPAGQPGDRHPRPGRPGGMLGEAHGGPGGELLHSESVVKAADGTITTVRAIRGTVTAVGTDSITVKADDGQSETFAVTADTEVRIGLPARPRDGQAPEATDSIGDVHAGDIAMVAGSVVDGTATADHVHAMTAEQAAQLETRRAEKPSRVDAPTTGTARGNA